MHYILDLGSLNNNNNNMRYITNYLTNLLFSHVIQS